MAGELTSFKDILKPRREESSNFMWISRKLNTAVAYKQAVKPTPKLHKQEVFNSPRIQELILKISENQHVSKDKVEQQVKLILDEIGFNKRLSIIRWLGLFLTKVCVRICRGIHVHEAHIIKIKNMIGNTPVMFLPSHRSYGDFILMSYVCFTFDIEIPAIAAGMDFHGMWGMGSVLRDTGAFFMRRSYNDDSLYWDTFRQYVHQLVTKGDLALEFFIEGTRSRTGKSLSPKYGLLSMILRPLLMGEVPDILLVPINITYDRVLEERPFAFELLGIPKPKESTSGLFKSLSLVNERYGDIYVNFGEPISARNFFNNQIEKYSHSLKPTYIEEITQKQRHVTSLLAHNIVYQQQKCCVITTFNIIALSVINNFLSGLKEMSLEFLVNNVVWINSILLKLNAHSDLINAKQNILESLNIHQGLIHVNPSGKIILVKNSFAINTADSTKLKGHTLSQETMMYAVPFVMLQIYVNPVLHYLVNPSLIVTILKFHGRLSNDILFGHFDFLQTLFSYEFITIENQDVNFFESLKYLRNLELIEYLQEKYFLRSNEALIQLFYNAVEPFLFIYYITCKILSQDIAVVWNEKNVSKAIQAYFEGVIQKHKEFIHPYCLNLDSLSNCLTKLSSIGVLVRRKINGILVYETNSKNLHSIITNLEKYMRLLLENEDLRISQKNICIECKL